jgi:hypothetical protein
MKSPPYSLYVICTCGELASPWRIIAFAEGGLTYRILQRD